MQSPVAGERSPVSDIDEDLAWAIKPGNEQDELDMRRLGQKQQLSVWSCRNRLARCANSSQRSFHSFSILGLTTIVTNTWLAWLTASQIALINGGTAGAVWTYLAGWLLAFTTVLSLAEMASIAPTSGGQYHWASEFSPPSLQRPLSYLSGWLSALGWHSFIAAASYSTGNQILILASTSHPSYEPTAW